MHCGFMDSRLRRFPPDRASAVSYGQTVGNATRCPPLAHRSAAAHKLHSAQSNRYKIRESQNQIPGTGLSLFLPGDCPNDRDHRSWMVFQSVERHPERNKCHEQYTFREFSDSVLHAKERYAECSCQLFCNAL